MSKKRESLVDRFWKKFKRPKKGCWEWQGTILSTGYGQITESHGSSTCHTLHGAHRLSWMLFFGPIPDGLCVLHKCDNRKCVRPDHLFLGTRSDNAHDMHKKGRSVRGENHGRSILKADDIPIIRKMLIDRIPVFIIAFAYGVRKSTIKNIKQKKCWTWVK